MSRASLEDTIKEKAKTRNNGHYMLVDGMSKLMTGEVPQCQSSDFYAYGLKWNFRISSGVVNDYLSFNLLITDRQCIGSNWEVQCRFRFRVVSQTGPRKWTVLSRCFDANHESWGKDSFVSYDELKERYLVNDIAVFYAAIIEAKPNFAVESISRTMATAESLQFMEVPRNNSKFTWKITQFSSFDSTEHSSYEFTCGPRRWRLCMYPKGHPSGGAGYLSLFLTATNYVTDSPKGTTVAVYKLRVLDQLKRNHCEDEKEEALFPNDPADPREKVWGKFDFLPLEELHNASRGFLVNDQIYIGVEFFVVSTTKNLI